VKDPLDALEAAAQATRQQRRTRTPEAKAARFNGRRAKQKGYRAERRMQAKLDAFGYWRVPMSGALGGRLSGDLRRDAVCAVQVLEVKARAAGWPVLRRWLAQGGAHALVLDEGERATPLIVLTLDTFAALLREAGYDGTTVSREG